jgi:hypothetical protein
MKYEILMGYITRNLYKCIETDSGDATAGELADHCESDDPYFVVMEDGEEIETFDDYQEAKDYVECLKHHDALDIDYNDSKKMFELVKYDGYHNEWKGTGIYADRSEKLDELIKMTEM